jgi:hypothetical protein
MLLVLEIMLTITAWRKGYKGFALIPVGLAVLAGLAIGSNNPGADALSVIWLDILAIVILVVMIALANVPENEEAKKTEESGEFIPKESGQRELTANQTEAELN